MGTLIGAGSHARDIAATFDELMTVYAHHTDYPGGTDPVWIGVNDPHLRARIADEIGRWDESWIHPTAYLGPGCAFGLGTHVNYRASMTRTIVGCHTTIGPAVTICGDVTIGNRVLIGAGATICDRVLIEDDVTIGAGAVVLPTSHLAAGRVYVGVPARC